MEWFFDILDKIIQNRVLASLFGNFQWVDWVTIAFVIIGLIYGIKQGFFRCLAVTFETCLVLWIVFALEKKFTAILVTNMTFMKETAIRPAAYLFLILLVSAGAMLLDGRIKNLFHTKLTGSIKYTGGAIFGVVLLLLMLSLISKFMMLLPIAALHKPYQKGGSKTGEIVLSVAPTVYKFINAPLAAQSKK